MCYVNGCVRQLLHVSGDVLELDLNARVQFRSDLKVKNSVANVPFAYRLADEWQLRDGRSAAPVADWGLSGWLAASLVQVRTTHRLSRRSYTMLRIGRPQNGRHYATRGT